MLAITTQYLKTHARAAAIYAAVFVLGAGSMWLLIGHPSSAAMAQALRGKMVRENDSAYSLVNPVLLCDTGTEEAFPELRPLKDTMSALIASQVTSDSVDNVSLYLRSLKSGRWFEINGDEKYSPASMLKVFVMMAYDKEAEDDSSVLQKFVSFEASPNPAADTPGQIIPHLVGGRTYSVEALLRQMVVYSDNDALNTLVDNFDKKTLADFNDIFTELNIPSPATANEQGMDFMSVNEYSTLYRLLYSATYLTPEDSEKALMLLSETSYHDGIVAGVPATTTVAHKFGVARAAAQNGAPEVDELHDCGVVYVPNHPYLLCVMTRGSNYAELQQDIQAISKAAYQGLTEFYKTLDAASTTTTK